MKRGCVGTEKFRRFLDRDSSQLYVGTLIRLLQDSKGYCSNLHPAEYGSELKLGQGRILFAILARRSSGLELVAVIVRFVACAVISCGNLSVTPPPD